MTVPAHRRARLTLEHLESRDVPAASYLTAVGPGVRLTPLLTVGDRVGGYPFAGVPDGLGAFDNGDGTFTVLVNHELDASAGAVHAHGSTGAFVSRWVVRKSDLAVLGGTDLVRTVHLWDGSAYQAGTTAFGH